MASQPAEKTANPLVVIKQNLQAMEPEFKAALPPHIPVDKFVRVAKTALQNTPALVNADRRSLFGAFVRLAQDGLLPDGREAAIVMFGNKAQAMPMIAGILKKIRQSGEVAKVSAQVVYANDKFVVKYGFDEDVEHVPPALNEPRGEPIGAYATAVLKDGSQLLEVMSLEQIEQVRKVSRASGNGPWVAWFGEMARKTVMRRLSKRLPMSTDLEDEIFSRDETMRPALQQVPQEIEAEPQRSASRLDAIEAQISTIDDEPIDAEVIEEQAEELEERIEEQSPEVNDTATTNSEPENITENITAEDETHPGTALADKIIAEIKEQNAVMDVSRVLNRHELDIASMPEPIAEAINNAADTQRAAIRAEQAKAKEGAE
jgi:recombination protein RecT